MMSLATAKPLVECYGLRMPKTQYRYASLAPQASKQQLAQQLPQWLQAGSEVARIVIEHVFWQVLSTFCPVLRLLLVSVVLLLFRLGSKPLTFLTSDGSLWHVGAALPTLAIVWLQIPHRGLLVMAAKCRFLNLSTAATVLKCGFSKIGTFVPSTGAFLQSLCCKLVEAAPFSS